MEEGNFRTAVVVLLVLMILEVFFVSCSINSKLDASIGNTYAIYQRIGNMRVY